MSYRSNAAEVWYPEPDSPTSALEHQIDLLPPASLTQSLWRSLLTNLKDTLAPEKLPPLQLTSRPVDVGLPLGERLQLPWFRTIFTNLGDVISPETLPPLDLESVPVDVGELITDQLSHFWFSSLLRNLADRLVPEKLPALELTAKPMASVIPETWILLPAWSEVISTPKVFYPDKAKAPSGSITVTPVPSASVSVAPAARAADPTEAALRRDLRRSKIRRYLWIGMAAAQAFYLVAIVFWPHSN
jgi:hypothetical protein